MPCVTFVLLLLLQVFKIIAAAIVGSRLDFCNSLLAGTSVSNLTAFSVPRILLFEWSDNLTSSDSATSHLFFLICIGFRFATELVSKLKIAMVTFSVLQFQQAYYLASLIPRYVPARALRSSSSLSICVPPQPPWQPPNRFHLLLQIFEMHCQIICRLFQLFLFSEEPSSITYFCLLTLTVVQNLVRYQTSSMFAIQRQIQRQRTARKYHAAHLRGVPSERLYD